MLKKLLLGAVILFPVLLCSGTEQTEIFLPRGTPLYQSKAVGNSPSAFVARDTSAVIQDEAEGYLQMGPLDKNVRLLKVFFPDTRTSYWTFDELLLQPNPETGKDSFKFLPYLLPMNAGICCIAAAFLLFFLYFRKEKILFQKYLPFGIILLLQYGIVLYLTGATANIMPTPFDDRFYYKIAEDIAGMNFSGPWKYTIGLPLFYLPFIWIFRAASITDIRIPFYIFNSLLVMPVLLCMAYLAIKKMSSDRSALLVIALWFVMILFYHHRYFFFSNDTTLDSYLMKSFPCLPSLCFSFSYSELLVFLGYNALSDTISCALIFSCIAAALWMKPTEWNLVLFSALYALSCLVRINNVFFVPLLAFSLYLRYADNLRTWRQWVRFLLTGAVPFCLIFSMQLIVNTLQFGSPFIFPYVLHPHQYITRGFVSQMLPFGIRFLGINNFAYFAIGTLSFFFIANRKNRVILSLWTLPLIFFFFGYPVIFNNGTRFILPVYAGFVAALVLADIWKGTLSEKIRCAAVLLAGVFLTAPAATEKMEQYMPWNWYLAGMSFSTARWIAAGVILVSIAVICSFFRDLRLAQDPEGRKSVRRKMIFLAAFMILFHWGNPYAVAVLMLCAFLRTCYDAVILIRDANSSTTELISC